MSNVTKTERAWRDVFRAIFTWCGYHEWLHRQLWWLGCTHLWTAGRTPAVDQVEFTEAVRLCLLSKHRFKLTTARDWADVYAPALAQIDGVSPEQAARFIASQASDKQDEFYAPKPDPKVKGAKQFRLRR